MAKAKVTMKEIPFLKGDLNLDESVLKELTQKQAHFKSIFKEKIEHTKAESLKRYEAKIETLKIAKTNLAKEIDAEIKSYQDLVKELNAPVVKTPIRKGPVKTASVKKAPAKIETTKKIVVKKTSRTPKKK